MRQMIQRYKFVLILIPLALFIILLDGRVLDGFLSTNEVPDHFRFIGVLVAGVCFLIFAILRFDKNTNR